MQEGVAEREGFEPPLGLPPELISSQPPSASRPSLRSGVNHRFLRGIISREERRYQTFPLSIFPKASCPEKRLDEGPAFFCQEAFADTDAMWKPWVVLQVVQGSRDPPSGFADPEHHCFHPCFKKSPETHQAGFDRHIKSRPGKTIVFLSKAAVLKTVERKLRGFESYPLRQILAISSSGEVAEWSKASAC